jgi:hypothetical protein
MKQSLEPVVLYNKDNGRCHVSGIPLQKRFFPFCKLEKKRAHMTRANDTNR